MVNIPSSEPEQIEQPRRQLVAVLVVRDRKVLLVHNIKHGLRIEPPGGKLEPGETPEDAAKRETQEELGMNIAIGSLLGIYQTHTPEGTFTVHTYLCSSSDDPVPDLEPHKIGGFHWYTHDELRNLEALVPNMQAALQDLAAHLR